MSLRYFAGRRNGKSILIKEMIDAMRQANSEQPNTVTQKLMLSVDPEVKVWIDELVSELEKTRDMLTKYSQSRGADGLLAALQAEAANDASSSEDNKLLEIGQWVFDGKDDCWIGAGVDKNGRCFLYKCNSNSIKLGPEYWYGLGHCEHELVHGFFDTKDWDKSFIDRSFPDLDQDVFDDEDERWIGAAVDEDGAGYLFTCDSTQIILDETYWRIPEGYALKKLDGKFNALDWDKSFIDRQTEEPKLLKLGQWVFDGRDNNWCSAAVDGNGDCYLYERLICDLAWANDLSEYNYKASLIGLYDAEQIPGKFLTSGLRTINRYNFDTNEDGKSLDATSDDDVYEQKKSLESEYLDVCKRIDWFGVIDDEDSAPELSRSDLQRIFIQNLTTVLLQRMHSMDRYSSDDRTIERSELETWDVIAYWTNNGAAKKFSFIFQPLFSDWLNGSNTLRTIREDEIQEFREWAEAHYV